jgi:hypothetical protein
MGVAISFIVPKRLSIILIGVAHLAPKNQATSQARVYLRQHITKDLHARKTIRMISLALKQEAVFPLYGAPGQRNSETPEIVKHIRKATMGGTMSSDLTSSRVI